MTTPDSGGWFCGCGVPISGAQMGCARWPGCVQKPDSGEREVRLQMALAVFSDMANPQRGMAEADAETRAHWLQSCARHALVKLSAAVPPDFSLVRADLAQRILAALEQWARLEGGDGNAQAKAKITALASELRAAVERKP